MPTFLTLAALLGLSALIMRSRTRPETAGAAKALPPSVKDAIACPQATKTELETAAHAAHAAGYPLLADELAARASGAPAKKVGFPSPIRAVPHAAWTRFVAKMAVSDPAHEGAKGYYGMFLFGVRRLCDLGIMKNPRKTPAGWTAEWRVPPEKFLGDGRIQVAAFGKSMAGYHKIILARYGRAIGMPVAGKSATVSGLLAVAHFAGAEGLGKWITDPGSRKPETTAAYLRGNGIF